MMGNWDGAIIRSIGWVLLFVIAYSFYEMGFPVLDYPIIDFMAIVGLFTSVYLAISIVGWLLIGLPFHWAICKWSTPKTIYYLFPGVLVVLALVVSINLDAGIVLGMAATMQSVVFRYYVFKEK